MNCFQKKKTGIIAIIFLTIILITSLSVAQPTADFTFSFSNSGCNPDSVVFTNTSTGAVSYLWDFGDFSPVVNAVDTSHWYSDGTFIVTLIAYDGIGDSSVTSQVVNISMTPFPGWAGFSTNPNPVCFGTTVNFMTSIFPPPTSVLWDFGDGYGSTLFNPSHIYSDTGTYYIILIASNECGSDAAVSPPYPPVVVDLTAVSIPVFSASPTTVCPGEPVVFDNYTSPAPANTLWIFGDGDTANTFNSVHSYSDTGSYNVYLNISNACGSAMDSIIITVDNSLMPAIGITASPNPVCPDGTVSFTVNGNNLMNFIWDFDNGDASLQQNPAYAFPDTGTYNVLLTATNSCGNTASDSVAVIVDSITAPIPNFSYNPFSFCPFFSNICPGTEVGFSNNSIYAESSYWDFGDGDTSTITNPTHVFADTGSYIVKLIVTSPCGGKDSIERCVFVVNDVTPSANFCYNLSCFPSPVCPGTPVTFINQSSDTTNCFWDFGDGDTSIIANPTHVFADTGMYTVILRVTNDCGNTAFKGEIINVSYDVGPPEADFSMSPASSCPGETISFSIISTDVDTSNILWDFGDGNTSTMAEPTHVYGSSWVYDVTLIVYTACGNDTVVKEVIVRPGASPDFTYLAGCAGGDTTLFFDASAPLPDSWAWDIDGDTSSSQNPYYVFASPGAYGVTLTVTESGCVSSVTKQLTLGTSLITNITDTDSVSCNGLCNGDATVSVTGGITPYAYLWDTLAGGQTDSTANNLCAGSYSVIVTDANGCADTSNVTISEPSAITLVLTGINAGCDSADGTAIVSASGGIPPYLYLWDDSVAQTTDTATGLTAGVYTVIITDSLLCNDTGTVIVNDTGAATVSISFITDVSCNGSSDGIAAVTASGGIIPYTYLWDPATGGQTTDTAIGLIAGTYTVTVTDSNSCVSNAIAVINEPPELTSAITDSINISCNGLCDGFVTVTPSGGSPPYYYLWDDTSSQTTPTADSLCNGIYTVIITDTNGCTDTSVISLSEPLILTTNITDSTNINCIGFCDGSATVTAVGGTSPYTYSWNTVPAQSGLNATGLCAGVLYTVIVADSNGCIDSTDVMLTEPSSSMVVFLTDTTGASCYGVCDGESTVLATGGTSPYTYNWNTIPPQSSLNATGLCAGTYNVIVNDANGCDTTISVNISEPSAVLLSLDSTNISCNSLCDGSATVSVSGGTIPYTYLWNTSPPQTDTIATGLCPGTHTVIVTDAMGCNFIDSVTISEPLTELTSAITDSTNLNCYGSCVGYATVTAGGGTPFYMYSWNTSPPQNGPNAIGLCAGTYTVIVTDANGCTDTSAVTLTEPPAIALTLDSIPDTCGSAVGQAWVIASNGVLPYTYAWDDTSSQTTDVATGLIAGTYNVTVTDSNGCTTSGQITVGDAGAPMVSISSTADVSCYGGSNGAINITVSGGTPGYTYSWTGPNGFTSGSADINMLEEGAYDLTVVDSNGCSGAASTILVEPPLLTSAITGSTNVSCVDFCDGSSMATASGGTIPYTYLWSPSGGTDSIANNLCADAYIVIVTDSNACTDTVSVMITEPDSIIIESTVDTATQGINDGIITLTVTGGTSPYTYLWNDPNAQTDSTATGLFAGTYSVTVTDANGCIDSASIEVPEDSVINTLENPQGFQNLESLRIHPNPTKGLITFDIELAETRDIEIQIFNVLGESFYNECLANVKENKYEIDLGELPDGLYFVKVSIFLQGQYRYITSVNRKIIIAR